MKKYTYIGLCVLALSLGSCKKYLSQVPDDIITTDKIFTSRTNTDNFLANIYSAIPNELTQRYNGTGNSGPWTASSDEAKYNWDFNYSNNMNASTWSNTDGDVGFYWNAYYIAIRNATYFMQNIDSANPVEVDANVKKTYKAEARGLRALFYFWLLRTYGPVPIIGDKILDVNAPITDLRLPRNSFDEGIDFVVSELDGAAADLEATPNSAQYGRITSGICKAYKVEALMLKASPLYNGNTDYAALKNKDGKQLISQTVDVTKWTAAATAAKSFITTFVPTTYQLFQETDSDPFMAAYKSCRDVVTTDWNSEWIFARSNSGSYTQYDRTPKHVGAATPSSANQGGGALGVTQTMVDAYFMANGLPITDQSSGYVSTGFSSFKAPFDVAARNTFNPWVGREARFYVGVTYTNSYWLNQVSGSTLITDFTLNGNSGRSQSTSDVTPTGYTVRKDVTKSDGARGAIMLRLANIYLDYAEALNESTPGDADILKYLNLIRQRADVPAYGSAGLPAPANQNDMRLAIRAERRVELAFENARYFDTRRWKIAESTDAGQFFGMDMSKSDNSFYNKTLLETRVFKKRDYLFPIPNDEVLKNNNMVQNTGW
ncbi:RagB/SusD family nutrient uptake outer membrane protein [Mucilaginibacter sp. SMC90]|uniref:RagB/SusD family nutrient uptake outer membrane protein n=1 Tax=Mucilaginibacter sp. SMC90 TaxID=2929803 RepID=UPI001FB4C3CE|nr:RagB/SusD family nutrient uptake outer membrane protein [Mucilaginibacter sp. SMC90]UOE50656.1 RagB/SusD family nutrient uptake outer membrane protein [Mucilaginibacter sp. SMC90]